MKGRPPLEFSQNESPTSWLFKKSMVRRLIVLALFCKHVPRLKWRLHFFNSTQYLINGNYKKNSDPAINCNRDKSMNCSAQKNIVEVNILSCYCESRLRLMRIHMPEWRHSVHAQEYVLWTFVLELCMEYCRCVNTPAIRGVYLKYWGSYYNPLAMF